jgi:hypothetical protein
MKLTKFAKGLILAIVTLVLTSVTTTGWPAAVQGWEILGITVLGTSLTYIAKNAIFPSISILGTINLSDVASGAILAVGAGISNWAATAITSVPVHWNELLELVGSILVAYLAKKFASHPDDTAALKTTTA